MTEFQTFLVRYETKKGSFQETVKAFNRQQAKRKMLSHISLKHDAAKIRKIELLAS